MNPPTTTPNSRSKTGAIYPYFYCLGRNKKRTACALPYLDVQSIEESVEEHYRTVQLSVERATTIRASVKEHLELYRKVSHKEIARQTARLKKLDVERRKLLEAHYAEAVPLDLLREEQARIKQEQGIAQDIIGRCEKHIGILLKKLDEVLDVARSAYESYRIASPKVRRELNQVFFDRVYINPSGVVAADLAVRCGNCWTPSWSRVWPERRRRSSGFARATPPITAPPLVETGIRDARGRTWASWTGLRASCRSSKGTRTSIFLVRVRT